jgi:hypothetical protein
MPKIHYTNHRIAKAAQKQDWARITYYLWEHWNRMSLAPIPLTHDFIKERMEIVKEIYGQ